jgi:hypothetical protein
MGKKVYTYLVNWADGGPGREAIFSLKPDALLTMPFSVMKTRPQRSWSDLDET